LKFIAVNFYEPSYLSLRYTLSKYVLLTEAVKNITLISKKKTQIFSNQLFISNFITTAKLVKALFDFCICGRVFCLIIIQLKNCG